MKKKKKILVIAPHPDDESIGCGGTILKYRKLGYEVNLAIFTKMPAGKFSKKKIEIRKREILKIKSFYNFKNFIQLEYEASNLDNLPNAKIIQSIKEILNKYEPSRIYIPSIKDIHTDHVKISRCFLSCIKIFRHKYLKEVMAYETLSETNFNFSESFCPNYFEEITSTLNSKIKAIQIYKSEIKKHPFPRSIESIKALAVLRGSQSGYKFAEAFELIFSRK